MKKNAKLRVAKYKRVSTDEQKLKKNSIIAQDELLDQYIANNPNLILVGDFSDEGVSGTKLMRTELQSLLEMVEHEEVDLILVTKLDRWFRNVGFYYKVQEILDRHNVAWKTILEDYDTTTASGKLNINIALTLAQHETDKTSDRIKVVFDSKLKHKQAISGSQPLGFAITNGNGARKVIRDPKVEHVMRDLIDHVRATHSVRGTMVYINDKYDLAISYNSMYRLLRNTMLYGHYKGVDDYCEAYMTKEEFDDLQNSLNKNIRKRKTNRTYFLAGLVRCPVCGGRLAGTYKVTKKNDKEYHYNIYRCPRSNIHKLCSYKKVKFESTLERKLLDQVLPQFEQLIIDIEVEEKKGAPRINKTAIREEMDRLNKMFQKNRISEDEYDQQYESLEKKLYTPQKPKKDYSAVKELLHGDFKDLYKTFSNEEKQIFWRSIVDYIEIVGDDLKIHFL